MNEIKHGPWRIYFEPPPIPIRTCDWQFVHDGYDGPGDRRHGSAASVEDAVEQIREIEEMDAEWQDIDPATEDMPFAEFQQVAA